MRFKKKSKSEKQKTRVVSPGQAPIFSYYSSRSQSVERRSPTRHSPNQISKKTGWLQAWWLGYLPAIISLGVVVLAFMYVTTLSSDPRIQIVPFDSRPAAIQDIKVYEVAANKLLSKSILNRSKLTINTDKVVSELKQQFPELGDTVLTVPLISRRPIITIQPAIPVLLVQAKSGTFVIDETGRTVLESKQLQSSTRDGLPTVIDQSGADLELGKQNLTTDLVGLISSLQAHFTLSKVKISSYSLPTTSNEVHVHIEGKAYYIKFTVDADSRVQVGTYLAVAQKLDSEGITPSEYIDVRIEERAYYR